MAAECILALARLTIRDGTKTRDDKITMFELSCFCALALVTLAIASRMIVLIHEENDDTTVFLEMQLALHVALILVLAMTFDAGIKPECVWLRHKLPHGGTQANRTIAAVLAGLECVVFVFVVPWALVAFERLRRDLLTTRRVTNDLMDRLRVERKESALM
ncbi:hypothetical protein M3I54_32765 [Paraburkholderia sp. CNPSo 3274]|uniref:hypothetical protein n=1 Tax=Paraburkholderia sp. CNPSo 3274 TaxID=2940932 RepID=UPI0020B78066|nr:hypothetical protein [Paraburkholderia sp. CNPSo 3274]MCP3711669.1 hypothetical protein [Paraburkholderia sp. CNPSo 3274]